MLLDRSHDSRCREHGGDDQNELARLCHGPDLLAGRDTPAPQTGLWFNGARLGRVPDVRH